MLSGIFLLIIFFMKLIKKNFLLLVLSLLIFLSLSKISFCIQPKSPVWIKPSKKYTLEIGNSGGKLIRSTTSDPRSFNPILAKETSTTVITSLLFEGLTKTNVVTLEAEPNLAKNWKVDETGKNWIFSLRKDVYWSDGEEFTADDVVFTFNKLIYNPDIPNSSRDIFTIGENQIQVKKVDKYKVKFVLPTKFAPFLRSLSQEILPEHKLKQTVKNNKFNSTWGINVNESDVVGTGPFVLKKYFPGERITLGRNIRYWKKDQQNNKLPYLNEIIFVILQSQDTALLKFMDKEIDYYSLRGEDLAILGPLHERQNFTIYNAGPAFGSNFLTFNQNPDKNPNSGKSFIPVYKLNWFTNKNFRKAIAYAIDRQKIIEIVYSGLAYSQFSPLSPSSGYFYNEKAKKYKYNLVKAKDILKDAGFIDRDKDGFIEDSEGNRIEFTLYTNTGNSERIKIAAMVRKDLENIGMDVNFFPLEFNNLVTKLTSSFNWEIVLIGLTGGIEPHFGKNVWHSSGTLHMWHPYQEKPYTTWEKKINDIFNQAAQTLDRKKRKELYDEWQMIVSEKLPVIYTVIPASVYAVRNKFGNLYPTVYGGPFGEIEYVYQKTEDR